MNGPLWRLLELTIETQLQSNPDAAYNTLDSFINTHVHANPSHKERIEIIKKLNQMLARIRSPQLIITPPKITKEKRNSEREVKTKQKYNIY